MASNLELLDDSVKTLKQIVPILDNTDEAKLLQGIMSELRDDIDYVKKELETTGKSIDGLQIEVYRVKLR